MQNATTVLIIDDSLSACLFMSQALQNAGYRAITATDGRDGVTKAVRERPHCVVLDVILPGASGFEVCRQLRARDPDHHLPIILVSTKNTPLDQKYGLSQGADRYLPKPFTEEALVQLVGDVLPRHLHPPAALWHSGTPPQRSPELALLKLIPRRCEDPALLTSSNPLASSVVIPHKQARRLHAAIDGRKTVEELCRELHINAQEILGVLQVLLGMNRIQLYTTDGKRVNSPLSLIEL